jgi:hypothetical protein
MKGDGPQYPTPPGTRRAECPSFVEHLGERGTSRGPWASKAMAGNVRCVLRVRIVEVKRSQTRRKLKDVLTALKAGEGEG